LAGGVLSVLLTAQPAAAQPETPSPPVEVPAEVPVVPAEPSSPPPAPPPAAPAPPMVPFAPAPAPPPTAPWTPPPPIAPPWSPPRRHPDLSSSGLPLAQRGRVGFDVASYLDTAGERGTTALELVASLPLTARAFVDVVAPLGFGSLAANPSLGARYVQPIARGLFVSFGGAVALPLLDDESTANLELYKVIVYDERAVPSGYWNYRLYALSAFPVTGTVGLEAHRGLFELRLQAEPTWLFGLGDEPDPGYPRADPSRRAHRDQGLLPHALEAQVGHRVAGGVRLQGVVIGWGEDNYQAAVEPFFALERELFMLRLGLLLPLDAPLAPAFEDSWGFRFSTGIRLE